MDALILIDIQNDFCPGGSLAVRDGDKIVPVVNELQKYFNLVIATKDWHPPTHSSFVTLWPPHCVQNTAGAEFHPALDTSHVAHVFLKGTDLAVDSYSGFFDNEHKLSTGLGDYLRAQGVTAVFVCGLATDYCIKFTALDALRFGFETTVVADACRGVDVNAGDSRRALEELSELGARVATSEDVIASRRGATVAGA